jgi:spore maturation protein SpmB
MNEKSEKRNFLQSFVLGARSGFNLSFTSMAPNVLFAFAMIQILNLTGLTDLIGIVFGPVMGIFGLPGISATVIIAGILSTGGGIGVAAGLATNGHLDSSDVAILLVGIMLFGSLVQYIGRVLGPAGIKSKHYPMLIGVNLLAAFLAMFVTQFLV